MADVPTQLDTCVTSIYAGASDNKHLAAVSFADGHVKLFDTRKNENGTFGKGKIDPTIYKWCER